MLCFLSREESWSGKGSKNGTEDRPERDAGEAEDRAANYDGPPGMDPDGVIESNWDKVSYITSINCLCILAHSMLHFCRLSTTLMK